jgi:hypothetical protein
MAVLCMLGARTARLLETWCLMEYAEKGSLADLLRRGKLMRADGRFCDMFSALACLTDIASGAALLGCLIQWCQHQ